MSTSSHVLVIAHRANLTGADHARENSLARTRQCIERAWSVETDIRRDPDGRFYISHDPACWTDENDAAAFCEIWRTSEALVALNVKELGDEVALICFLEAQQVLDRVFLFDMELLETHPGSTARRYRAIDANVRLGARVSDRGESVTRALAIDCTDIIWLDEFDGPWATASDVATLLNAQRTVYAVSPELHGRSETEMHARWHQLISMGVHGICTDHPESLEAYLSASAPTQPRRSVA